MLRSQLRSTLLRWVLAAERRVIPNEKLGNLLILYGCDAATRTALAKNVRLALALIKLKAPGLYRRVQTELASVSFIALGPRVALGRFTPATRDCFINATPLIAKPDWAVIEIAFVLVHETAHAWLHRHGVRMTTLERRQRVERVCNRAEACLAARIPELRFLGDIVARRRSDIQSDYSGTAHRGRQRSYYWALVRGMFGG